MARLDFAEGLVAAAGLNVAAGLILPESLDLGAGLEFSAGLEIATGAVMPSKCSLCLFEFVNIHVRTGFSYMLVHLLQACT